MSSTTVIGFAIQAPSAMSKVYASFAALDADGTMRTINCYGPEGTWKSKRMSQGRAESGLTPAAAMKKLKRVWTTKESEYDTVLAGPVAFTVHHTGPLDGIDPAQLLAALSGHGPSATVGLPGIALAFDAIVSATAAPQRRAKSAPAKSRTFLPLSKHEAHGIQLPDGRTMFSRTIAGHADVEVLRHLRAQTIVGGPVLGVRLVGPPGSGKSTLPLGAFGADLITVNGHGDMTVADLVGKYVTDPDSPTGFTYQDGPLAIAMLDGRPFLFDEASRVPSEVLAVLNSVTDGRGVLNRDDIPGSEPIVAKQGFFAMLAYNERGQGVRRLDDSILRRFPIAIECNSDYTVAEQMGVDARAIKVAKEMHKRSTEDRDNGGEGYWVPQIADLLVFQQTLDAGLGVTMALATMISICWDDSRQILQDVLNSEFGTRGSALVLGPRAMAGAA